MRKVLLCGAFLALAACSRDEEVQIPDSKQAHWIMKTLTGIIKGILSVRDWFSHRLTS